ncbi:hypothetical protein JE010_23440 [Pseudomonas aeruginosa]|uniref:DUF3322 domain-containing protein n=1 Tax=Pseudomonas aeruginosa TaxID=287 RepID=UPI00046382EF|nr:DUF3322 domain-containing protein [Pseudomonas aeruginosa]MBI8970368.1 hypothetical protein [Pseudomonas aeruginosa]WCY23510.1 hypothetical protein KK186_00120 [Pseudomonas aeruginosa]HBO5728521.1 hypothetical protein [Pseudomonas aeruginosa]
MRDWGRLPDDVVEELRRLEWDHTGRLRERLLGARPFPIPCLLKPPTGSQALEDLDHFHGYIAAWRKWPWPHQVAWVTKRFRQLGECEVPIRLEIESTQALIAALGAEAVERSRGWVERMEPLLSLDKALFTTLIKQLGELEKLSMTDIHLLACLLPQLQCGMGQRRYLRALPLQRVDTKFVELNQSLIAALLDSMHDQEVSAHGGLEAWLGCRATPSNWLHVKPLCPDVKGRLAGLDLVRLSFEQLMTYPLPARSVLVIENLQAGYGLPELPGTIAVFGGGANTAWLQAEWLKDRRVGYWGDLDTWGLKFLADARLRQPHVEAVMMDRDTLIAHVERGVCEDRPAELPDYGLTLAERSLFEELRSATHGVGRLEQERLSQDYVEQQLAAWTHASAGL